jgi:hypothetical protein
MYRDDIYRAYLHLKELCVFNFCVLSIYNSIYIAWDIYYPHSDLTE